MNRMRVLLLAPDANPESISLALEGYSHSEALAQLHDVTLVVHSTNEGPLRRAQAHFHSIVGIRMPLLDRIYEWSLHWIFKDNFHSRALTPFLYPFSIAFEWYAWRRLRKQIIAGEFDVVMRLLPANPVLPSPFPYLLRNCSVPFVIGPINGGLPWPQGFSQAESQRSWIDSLRNLYRFLPFSRSTFRRAAAIIAGSSQTYAEFCANREKLFFIAENGVNRSLCPDNPSRSQVNGKLEFIFVGALVPYKACDLALRASASSLRNGLAHLTVVGDGPERNRLEQLASTLGIKESVSFSGMLSHAEAMERLRSADVMVYPSVREYGGAVVVEALAAGAVPCVADFGGPGDTVRPEVGFKVPLTNESEVVLRLERDLVELTHDRDLLERLRQRGMAYVRENLTWDAKAQSTTKVLNWVAGRGPKPDFPPPRVIDVRASSSSKKPYRPQEA
jgi:glycosyltransferase involved in cell wall biosynthesis